MLTVEHIQKTYGQGERIVRALDGVSLEAHRGEFVAVRGPSGCGKTTLLLAAGGLLQPDAGCVLWNGEDPYARTPESRAAFRASNVGFVFQQFHLIGYLSVMDNVLAASLAMRTDDAHRRAERLIESFGLSDRMHHVPAELSTGERQRVGMARALLNSPKLLLADEPTGNLDAKNAEVVLSCLAEFARSGGTVLLVTHDVRAAACAQRTIELRSGRLAEV